jgi:hypothetical protein
MCSHTEHHTCKTAVLCLCIFFKLVEANSSKYFLNFIHCHFLLSVIQSCHIQICNLCHIFEGFIRYPYSMNCVVCDYRLDGRGSIPDRGREFFL